MRILDDDAAQLLDAADQLYIAIKTKNGPHVTPELFARDGDRLVCLSAATTLKSRLARDHAMVGIVVRHDGRALTGVGTATVIDPTSPSTSLGDLSSAVAAPIGVARFVADNATELVGAAVDLLRGRLGDGIPPHRVVLAIGLSRVAVGEDVAGEPSGGDCGELAAVVPAEMRHLVVDGPVVVGWLSADGAPLALPGMWDAARSCAVVSTAVLDGLDATRDGAACVTFDEWTGYGPSGKRGFMVRGAGTSSGDGGVTRLQVEPTRIVTWDGVETSSAGVAS